MAITPTAKAAWRGDPVSATHSPNPEDQVAYLEALENSVEAASAGRVDQVTWAGLNAITGTRVGQPGLVYGPDASTHTDPVVGGTVANTGSYIWSASPAGWQRVSALVEWIDQSDLDSAVADLEAADALLEPKTTFSAEGRSMVGQNTKAEIRSFINAATGTELDALTETVNTIVDDLNTEESTRETDDDFERRMALALPYGRPGDAPGRFSRSLASGDPEALTGLTESDVTEDDNGRVIRITGADYVTQRGLFAIETSRTYKARFVVRRRTNSTDPSNDTVRCAIAWYDQNRTAISSPAFTTIENITDLTTSSGRTTVTATVSMASGDDITTAPTGTRYIRMFVQTFGTIPVTDVEVLQWEDITDATAYSPDLTTLTSRVDSLESADADARLTVVEAAVTTPDMLRLPVADDIDSYTVPASVDAIEVLGKSAVGDGPPAVYARGSEPSHSGKKQSDDGAWWVLTGRGPLHVVYFGASGSGDETTEIENAISTAATLGRKLLFKSGVTYTVDQVSVETTGFIDVDSDGPEPAILAASTDLSGPIVEIKGTITVGTPRALAKSVASGARKLYVSTTSISAGDLIELMSTEAWGSDPRAPDDIDVAEGLATAATASTITLDDWDTPNAANYVGKNISIRQGTGFKQARTITAFDSGTGVATITPDWDVTPSTDSYWLIPQCHKGELHRVRRVIDSSTLELEAPLNGGYDLDLAAASIRVATPVRGRWGNVMVSRVGGSATSVRALQVEWSAKFHFDRIPLKDVRQTGVANYHGYQATITNPDVDGADGLYTGYGVQSQCSALTLMTGGRFGGTRRGADAHSSYLFEDREIPAWGDRWVDCDSYGGGLRSDDAEWGPVGGESDNSTDSAENYGFGTHGPSWSMDLFNCRAWNVHAFFLSRSINVSLTNCTLIGPADYFAKVWYGGNVYIKGCKNVDYREIGNEPYADLYTIPDNFDTDGVADGDFRDTLPLRAIEIQGAGDGRDTYRRGRVVVSDCDFVVRESFMYLREGGEAEWTDIEMRDNRVKFYAASASDYAWLVNGNANSTLKRCVDVNNQVLVERGVFQRYRGAPATATGFTLESTCTVYPFGGPRQAFDSYSDTTAITDGINPASNPSSSAGAEILAITPFSPAYPGARINVSGTVPCARSDANGLQVVLFVYRYVANSSDVMTANACVLAREITLPAQSTKGEISFNFEDTAVNARRHGYRVRIGPKSGETGTVHVAGSAPATAQFGTGAAAEMATLTVREVFA